MLGDNSLVIEKSIANATCDEGYRTQIHALLPCDIANWRTAAGLILTATSVPKIVALTTQTANYGAVWVFDATAAMTTRFEMPDEWANRQQDIIVYVKARKIDATTDENADLAITLTARWISTDGVTVVTQVVTSSALAASTTGAGALAVYSLDLGAALRAASKTIPRGASVQFELGPNEQVGTTNMILEVSGVYMMLRRHATLKTETLRKAK